MGEAKRRKLLDPNYGQQKLVCFLEKAQIGDGHAIYLQLPKETERTRIISVHKKIETAYDILCKCNRLLETLVIDPHESSEKLLKRFLDNLIKEYGNYESDDAESLITDYGITFIKEPITRKYVVMTIASPDVYCIGLKDYVSKWLLRLDDKLNKRTNNDVADLSGFVLQEINGKKWLHSFSYFIAAYIADYMSDNSLELPIDTALIYKLGKKANELKKEIQIANNVE